MIDPDKLNLAQPYFTSSEFKNLPFFHSTASKQSEKQSQTEKSALSSSQYSNTNTVPNPAFAHRITTIKATKPNTEVFFIDRKIYKKFLSTNSPFHALTDK